MCKRLSIFVVVVAALIAAEPLLHNHPLQQNGIPDACAVCANGAASVPSASPSIAAPQTIVYTIAPVAVTIVTGCDALSLTSRAPPA